MFLQLKNDGELIKVSDVQQLINPNADSIEAKQQRGQEEQPLESFKKANLVFPSGESLPRCWMDADYKNG
ncbi:MAG: acetyltransferase [Richelia sp. RM2_1_2]|nr:acetyltransferase [Richelia sp. SM2_1_7]NJM18402.1 acetyltransferase [Richelia sp. SM1_7_0]NJN07302.1 acetyltransferase [Richelia sp. RM1_1_1]NJO29986.1 acetyltransferase [Richelia sp. SL_2_1]NJO60437.1 acetyltransferase [Richelia sp. RM2_1_2]